MNDSKSLRPILTACALSAILTIGAGAQTLPQLIPFTRTGDLFVADSSADGIWRLMDLDGNGDYNGPGEVISFYDNQGGPIAISSPVGIAAGPDGTIYVSDTSQVFILALLDANGDGDAMDTGEAWVFFDGTAAGIHGGNASGITLGLPNDLTVDAQGAVWVANAGNAITGGNDSIVRLQDLGGLPGANEAGEALEYITILPGASPGDSIPTDVAVGPGGFLYYLDNTVSGSLNKGIQRLHDDVVPNGNCQDPGEASLYFGAPPQGSNAFHWGMTVDSAGAFYVSDHGNDLIWRCEDVDGDLSISPNEARIWWNATSGSTIWRVAAASDGALLCAESSSPDRILMIRDDVVPNGQANDPGETRVVYDSTVSATTIPNPRSLAFVRSPTLIVNNLPSIGSTIPVITEARSSDILSMWVSSSPASIPAYPLGEIGISLLPPDVFGELYFTIVPPSGVHTINFVIPAAPSLSGLSITLQGIAGPFSRLQLTNPETITIL